MAYQFHGCNFHVCPKFYDPKETKKLKGKAMATPLENTRCNTASLRRHVEAVEMWECDWKELRQGSYRILYSPWLRDEPDVKTFLDIPRHRKWMMTEQQILAAVIDGTPFSMVEYDIHIPEHLQDHFAEMQPVFKNVTVTRDDIGPFMRQ